MTFDLSPVQNYWRPRDVLALTFDEGRLRVSLVGGKKPSSFSMALGDDADLPREAGRELASLLDAAGLRNRRCVVCIPPSWALSASADLPEVNAEDLRGYFELRAEREFSAPGLRLAHSRYELPDGTRRATLAGVPGKRIEALEAMLAEAGCRIVSLSLALGGALTDPAPALHFLARRDGVDLLVSIGGGIALMRSMPGGRDGAALAREIRMTLGRLPEAVRGQVRSARWRGPAAGGLREILEPLGIADFREDPQPGVPSAELCAERYLKKAPVPFEFIVPEVNRWPARFERFNTGLGRRVAAGIAGALALLLVVFLVRSHMESSLQAEWDGMRGRVSELDGIQQNVRRFRPWFSETPQKLAAFETLLAAFPAEGEVWARSVQIGAYVEKTEKRTRAVQSTEALKVAVSGFSRSQTALMGLQDRLRKEPGVSALQLQQVRGNNPMQFSLTFKWEPKHDN